jgi:hypothetical protein
VASEKGSDVNKDWAHKDKDKDKDQTLKDKDKDKDQTLKDKDKDEDFKLVLKDSLKTRTRTRINITGCQYRPKHSTEWQEIEQFSFK